MMHFVEMLTNWMWGVPLIVTMLAVGLFFTVFSRFFQFSQLRHILQQTFGGLFHKNEAQGKDGILSPFEAISVAVGGTIGVGNIGGVATAIAVGGPGALFWLLVAGVAGQMIKMVEVTLAVHYRSKDENGNPYGGPPYYMKKGIGEEMGFKTAYKILSFLFLFGMFSSIFITMQNYTVSEAIASTFNFNQWAANLIHGVFPQSDPNAMAQYNLSQAVISIFYAIITYIMIAGGLKKLGRIASIIVPFMCIFYLGGGLVAILKNLALIPATVQLVLRDAFTGTAAIGGFAGATFAIAIQKGLARAVFSNEAGWGTSPMIHSTARTDHPIRQGLWGIFEVTISTMLVCTITAFTIIITSRWQTGLSGATLTLSAFETGMGSIGRIVLTVGIFLFGITTSSGWYTYYEILFRYILKPGSKVKERALTIYKWTYPIPGMGLVLYAVYYGLPSQKIWTFADFSTGLPTFANIIAIMVLSPKFFTLLRDYKARHMGIGKIDPKTRIFYES
ncbi:MAG: sodium:alanine symporter family protein [Candidatus Delongbacteria bacterium]|nr:sodium:alanine symporter family protein [Candidatus Delongbacteria bacterium]